MATQSLTDAQDLKNPTGIRLQYEILKERMAQVDAIANAILRLQDPESHDYWLAFNLNEMLNEAQGWTELDSHFGIEGANHE
jgi:hypothetical protein